MLSQRELTASGPLVALSHSIRLRPGANTGLSVCSETLIRTEEGQAVEREKQNQAKEAETQAVGVRRSG